MSALAYTAYNASGSQTYTAAPSAGQHVYSFWKCHSQIVLTEPSDKLKDKESKYRKWCSLRWVLTASACCSSVQPKEGAPTTNTPGMASSSSYSSSSLAQTLWNPNFQFFSVFFCFVFCLERMSLEMGWAQNINMSRVKATLTSDDSLLCIQWL